MSDPKKETDRTLLLNGLAGVDGATKLKPFKNKLELGNLELVFDDAEKLIRLRIHEKQGRSRDYSVRTPQENLNV